MVLRAYVFVISYCIRHMANMRMVMLAQYEFYPPARVKGLEPKVNHGVTKKQPSPVKVQKTG